MTESSSPDAAVASLDPALLILIVVGAHLRAEVADRPLGYRLRERILKWQDEQDETGETDQSTPRLQPIVCTDLWYLNAAELAGRPAIAIGDPAVNAASAYFSSRLPSAFIIEGTLRVHLDSEFIERQAALWGVTQAATASAVDLFAERYLDEFMRAAVT